LYSLGKISSELLLKKYKNNMIKVTNLRLAGLVSPVFNDRIVNKLIDKVINKEEIEIVGGKQQFPLMDLRDAASAIRSLIDSDIKRWQFIYNLGVDKCYTIIDIANLIKEISCDYGYSQVNINFVETDLNLYADMDSSLFYKEFNWKPQFDMRDIVKTIFDYKLNKN